MVGPHKSTLTWGPFKKYVRSEGEGGVWPKANTPYKICRFPYVKNEQGGGGSKNDQIWANVLFEWPEWPPGEN